MWTGFWVQVGKGPADRGCVGVSPRSLPGRGTSLCPRHMGKDSPDRKRTTGLWELVPNKHQAALWEGACLSTARAARPKSGLGNGVLLSVPRSSVPMAPWALLASALLLCRGRGWKFGPRMVFVISYLNLLTCQDHEGEELLCC